MKVKNDSVNIWGLDIHMQSALRICDTLWKKHGEELVITSARDSIHSAGSLHYYGLAIDCRTHYFTDATKKLLYNELKYALTSLGFDVIMHSTHIHIEYDPK